MADIRNITSESEWAGLLSQSPYSRHGHSIEYQKIIQINDPRHDKWVNYLITIEEEQYLFPCEIINGALFSHEKYYAGLMPVGNKHYIDLAFIEIHSMAKHANKQLVLSYLQTDPIFEHIKNYPKVTLCKNANWTDASLMDVDKPYEIIWNEYGDKTRNMVRKARRGLEFGVINILEHCKDAVDCTKSKEIRHGALMPNYYRNVELFHNRQSALATILGSQAISFGAFFEGKLVAYINTIKSYHEAIISNLLSNVDYYHLAPNNGLFDFMIQYYCKCDDIKQLMYSFDGVEGVDKFKHSIGFKAVPVMRCVFNK